MAETLDDLLSTLVARLRSIGTDTSTVEVKSAVGGLPRTTAESISAFANGNGGALILGLSEDDGFRPAAGFDAQRIRDALARMCADDLEPPMRSDIEIVPFEGAQLVYLDIPPVDPLQRPCFVKTRGAYAGSFIRGGDGDRRLTNYEVTQLLSSRSQPTDDAQTVPGATLDDLDDSAVATLLLRLRKRPNRAFDGIDESLALVRAGVLASDENGVLRPTVAGLLCLGAYPQQFLPQLFVSFVALPALTMGEALSDGTRFLDNVTCDGTIPQMLEAVVAAVRRNMRTAAVIRGSGREDRYDYPVEVIRELVINALLHRDYSAGSRGSQIQVELYPNRLVVKSPGGLYGNVVPSQLGVEEVSSTRNAVLARLLADVPDSDGLPVSENRGSGLPRVMTLLRGAGMSPPAFDITPGHVHVTVPQHALLDPPTLEWIGQFTDAPLSDPQAIALALMRNTGSASNEMLRAWGIESYAATAALRGLVDLGLAYRLGGRRYATYELVVDPDRRNDTGATPPVARVESSSRRRIDAELQAVVEAIRSGHVTVRTITDCLGLTYATTNRRINTLLASGRIAATAAPHSRSRTFVVNDAP